MTDRPALDALMDEAVALMRNPTPDAVADLGDRIQAAKTASREKPPVETWYALVSDGTEFQQAFPPEFLDGLKIDVATRNARVRANTGRKEFWKVVEIEVQLPYRRDRLGD